MTEDVRSSGEAGPDRDRPLRRIREALRARNGSFCEALRAIAPAPPELSLVAEILDCGAIAPTVTSADVMLDRAWGFVWLAFGLETGEPAYSSLLLQRTVRAARRSRAWGGPGAMYGSLLAELAPLDARRVQPSTTHFLRNVGRMCRAEGDALDRPPAPPPFSALQSFALTYAPGGERWYLEIRDELLAAVMGQSFEEEVRLGLGL